MITSTIFRTVSNFYTDDLSFALSTSSNDLKFNGHQTSDSLSVGDGQRRILKRSQTLRDRRYDQVTSWIQPEPSKAFGVPHSGKESKSSYAHDVDDISAIFGRCWSHPCLRQLGFRPPSALGRPREAEKREWRRCLTPNRDESERDGSPECCAGIWPSHWEASGRHSTRRCWHAGEYS